MQRCGRVVLVGAGPPDELGRPGWGLLASLVSPSLLSLCALSLSACSWCRLRRSGKALCACCPGNMQRPPQHACKSTSAARLHRCCRSSELLCQFLHLPHPNRGEKGEREKKILHLDCAVSPQSFFFFFSVFGRWRLTDSRASLKAASCLSAGDLFHFSFRLHHRCLCSEREDRERERETL